VAEAVAEALCLSEEKDKKDKKDPGLPIPKLLLLLLLLYPYKSLQIRKWKPGHIGDP